GSHQGAQLARLADGHGAVAAAEMAALVALRVAASELPGLRAQPHESHVGCALRSGFSGIRLVAAPRGCGGRACWFGPGPRRGLRPADIDTHAAACPRWLRRGVAAALPVPAACLPVSPGIQYRRTLRCQWRLSASGSGQRERSVVDGDWAAIRRPHVWNGALPPAGTGVGSGAMALGQLFG